MGSTRRRCTYSLTSLHSGASDADIVMVTGCKEELPVDLPDEISSQERHSATLNPATGIVVLDRWPKASDEIEKGSITPKESPGLFETANMSLALSKSRLDRKPEETFMYCDAALIGRSSEPSSTSAFSPPLLLPFPLHAYRETRLTSSDLTIHFCT